MITVEDVRNCILHVDGIEDYLEDVRRRSCLMLETGDSARPIHVVCAPKDDYLSIIEAIMKCMHCQGTISRGTAPFHIDRNGYHLSLDAVPAWVCGQCGEPYLEETAVESIQNLLMRVDEQMTRLASGRLKVS